MQYEDNGSTSRITYKYYEKPMNSKYVILESSAMAHNPKMQSLSQEVHRRLSRTDELTSQTEKDRILDAFCDKMLKSGYSVEQCRNTILSGVRFHKKKKLEAEKNGVRFNRNLRCNVRRRSKLIKTKSDKTM